MVDNRATATSLRLEHWRFSGNHDFFGYGTDCQRDIKPGRLIDLKHHAGRYELLESGDRRDHSI